MNTTKLKRVLSVILGAAAAAALGNAAQASVTQDLEPASIDMGQSATLTISASGADATSIAPPMVPGLEFVAVGESQRIESLNGRASSTTSVTYQVIPQRPGVFRIPGETQGAAPAELTVSAGSGGAPAASAPVAQSGGALQAAANGSAFVRLHLTKHDLYVGETVPVDIEVGVRNGVVASLNGQPTLNGDAFTLEPLSQQPQRSAEVIDGKPFTVFSWHSALAAVKPGDLSLTMETPLTVRIQSFFGTTTERDVTVTSSRATFHVEPLPAHGRPADFSGAVGEFTVSSDVSDDKTTAGDPITLRLHVAGVGSFDRVNSSMLHDVAHWKTYSPTASFKALDQSGDRGEKTFDQPVIATDAGTQALPPLSFSWFDAETRRYVDAHTSALRVVVEPAADSQGSLRSGAQTLAAPASVGGPAAASRDDDHGLRPDHAGAAEAAEPRVPHDLRAPYLAAPAVLACAFLTAGFWIRRRNRRGRAMAAARACAAALQTAPLLSRMDQATAGGNAELFFASARQAVQRALARRWRIAPDAVTLDEARRRLGPATEVPRLFELADEAQYAKVNMTLIDFKRWKQVVVQLIGGAATS